MLRIGILDDHELFRKGVITAVNRFDFAKIVLEAESADDLYKQLNDKQIDILLLDIKLPEKNGVEVASKLKDNYPEIKTVALTMFGEEEYLEKMMEAGVQGFLLKNIDVDGIRRALHAISEGKQYFSDEIIPFFTKKYLRKNSQDHTGLTPREIEILKLIAQGKTNKEIAEKLFISAKTVTNHRTSILLKTQCKNIAELVAYAVKNELLII